MIVKRNLQELASALEPARSQMDWKDPKIWMVETGQYKVQGTNGNLYNVTCGRNEYGHFFVACVCAAGLIPGKYCYHALRAFESHIAVKLAEKTKKENQ